MEYEWRLRSRFLPERRRRRTLTGARPKRDEFNAGSLYVEMVDMYVGTQSVRYAGYDSCRRLCGTALDLVRATSNLTECATKGGV